MIAVAIGFVIAFVSALVAYRYRRLDQPIGLFSDFLYTIPSLALFQLLVPLTGITVTTVEVALVSYTLLILYRNILEGLRGVPPDVREAARGMGLTPRQTLIRVDLPLAAPAIIAGLRIATVSTISIATVAAFVLPQGLGYPIFTGIKQDEFKTEIIAAGCAHGLARARRRCAPGGRAALGHALEARVILADTFEWSTFPDAIRFIGDNPGLLWDKSLQQLGLSVAALAIAVAIALPLGVVLGHFHKGVVHRDQRRQPRARAPEPRPDRVWTADLRNRLLEQRCRAGSSWAVPPILTNAYFAVDEIDPSIVEAARGMGMRDRDVLLRVELPLALPLLFGGVRIAAVFVIATATIAAIAGGGGLGDIIVNQATYRLAGVVAASLCVSILAFAAAGCLAIARKLLTRSFVSQD